MVRRYAPKLSSKTRIELCAYGKHIALNEKKNQLLINRKEQNTSSCCKLEILGENHK